MPTAPPNSGLADIPSNFTINDWIDIVAGASGPPPGGGCESTATSGEGKLRFRCGPGHITYDDPILYPGQQAAAHLHHFFGNASTDYNSTYASLRATTSGSADGTCSGGPLNRTSYWFPAMIKPAQAGFPVPKVVKPAWIELYYMNQPIELEDFTSLNPVYSGWTTSGMGPFPNGLQMIFGWEHKHPLPPPFGVWGRENMTGAAGGAFQGTLPNLYTYAPAASPGVDGYWDNIFARIISPNCWDGVNLRAAASDTALASGSGPGRNHLAYPFQDGNGKLICPSTHKYRIPSLTVIVSWSNNGPEDWKTWVLSVDRHTGHNLQGGHGYHTDWFGAWDSDIQTIWENKSLALGTTTAALAGHSSAAGNLCQNDWGMTNRVLPTNTVTTAAGGIFLPEAFRYADIPAVPGQRRMRLNLAA